MNQRLLAPLSEKTVRRTAAAGALPQVRDSRAVLRLDFHNPTD